MMEDIQILEVRSIQEESLGIEGVTVNQESDEPNELKDKFCNYPKPPLSYPSLSALAFKNNNYEKMLVSKIYSFICKHFPYYRTADTTWKSSIRHNLSKSTSFMQVIPDETAQDTTHEEYEYSSKARQPDAVGEEALACYLTKSRLTQSCRSKKSSRLWYVNPSKKLHLDATIEDCVSADRAGVLASLRFPAALELILTGRINERCHNLFDSTDEEAEVRPPEMKELHLSTKVLTFTQFRDGVFPLITLYGQTPTDHGDYSTAYPVVK